VTRRGGHWTARIRVRTQTARSAERLLLALTPESAREVPRTRTEIARTGNTGVELRITADATGALRAAVNTHLGWVQLVLSTERLGELSARSTMDSSSAGEALI
jgi:tRNA threonylcarbamoyladenosine modification (KEOPS) complex  Pcc1 subunit